MANASHQGQIQNAASGINNNNANAVTTTKDTIWTITASVRRRTPIALNSILKMDGVLFAWMGQNHKMENAHLPLQLVEELL
jgi:hypothetical protein